MDMQFNVAQLMKEPVGAKRHYEFGTPELMLSEALAGDPADLLARDVRGQIHFTRLRGQLRAAGGVRARVELLCSRCLEPFVAQVEAPLEELFKQTMDVVSGTPLPPEPEPDADEMFAIDPNHVADLTEPARQALLVALPMRPLHQEDCRGLCPTCGTNLNTGACDCAPETADPRLAALARLLPIMDGADSPT